jgi:predicted HTH domain antitoxin
VQLEVQRLINYYDPTTVERAINQIKRYIRTGREMRLSIVIGSYEMDEVALNLGSEVNAMPK